jgi:hypothetical protein
MRFMFIVMPLRFPVTSYLNEHGLKLPGTLGASIPTGIPRPASIHRRLVLTGAGQHPSPGTPDPPKWRLMSPVDV